MTRTLDHSFEGAGPESWVAVTGTGSVNFDHAGPGSLPSGGGVQCCRVVKPGSASSDYAYLNLSGQTVTYSRHMLYIGAEGLASGESFDTIGGLSNQANGELMGILLRKSAGGQLELSVNFRQSSWTTLGTVSVATGAWYCVELLYRTDTLAIAAWVNDVSLGTATADSLPRGQCNRIFVGPRWAGELGNVRALTIYYDLIALDNAVRIGPPADAGIAGSAQAVATLAAALSDSAITGTAQAESSIAGNLGTRAARVQIAVNAEFSYALGIPRPKIAIAADGQTLIAACGTNSASGSIYRSIDAGQSWSLLLTEWLDYHASVAIDSAGRVFYASRIIDPSDGISAYRRYNGTSWEALRTWDDYGGSPASSTANVLVGAGNDVWLFFRDSHGYGTATPQRIYYRRSTDNGATFGAAVTIVDAQSAVWKRIGSMMLSGQPALVLWELNSGGTACNIKLFRWDGAAFAAVASNTLATTSPDPATRFFSVCETTNGTIHAVWFDVVSSNNVLRHASRSLAGSWAAPATITATTLGATDPPPVTLCAHGNRVVLAYVDNKAGTKQVFVRIWDGAAWGAETQHSLTASGACGYVSSPQRSPVQLIPLLYEQGAGKALMFGTIDAGVESIDVGGGASASASASGAVLTTVASNGAAMGFVSPAATLSVSIALAGGVQVVATPSGNAILVATLRGASIAQTVLAAAVTTINAVVGAAAAAQVTATGALIGWGSYTMAWDAVPGAAGYRIKVGTESGVYTRTMDIGAVTIYAVGGLMPDVVYYFAVIALDGAGQEGVPAPEISGTPDLPGDPVDLSANVVSAAVATAFLPVQHMLEGTVYALCMVASALEEAGATLVAQGGAETAIDGTLGTSIAVSGAVLNLATLHGAIGAAAAALMGVAAAQAGAQGGLTVTIALSGTALVRALTQANLLNMIAAQANAAAQALASGSLSGAAAALSGSSVSRALAQGDINVTIALQAGVAAQAVLSGGLTIGIPLAAAVLAASAGSGLLGTVIRLVGSTGAAAAPVGALSVAAPPHTDYIAALPRRDYAATRRGRTWAAAAHHRRTGT